MVRAASRLRLDTRGVLWLCSEEAGWQRRIPPIYERLPLLERGSRNLGFPSGPRLYEHIRLRYYWRGMWTDCIAVAQSIPARQ